METAQHQKTRQSIKFQDEFGDGWRGYKKFKKENSSLGYLDSRRNGEHVVLTWNLIPKVNLS
jgi:hypothetical protein